MDPLEENKSLSSILKEEHINIKSYDINEEELKKYLEECKIDKIPFDFDKIYSISQKYNKPIIEQPKHVLNNVCLPFYKIKGYGKIFAPKNVVGLFSADDIKEYLHFLQKSLLSLENSNNLIFFIHCTFSSDKVPEDNKVKHYNVHKFKDLSKCLIKFGPHYKVIIIENLNLLIDINQPQEEANEYKRIINNLTYNQDKLIIFSCQPNKNFINLIGPPLKDELIIDGTLLENIIPICSYEIYLIALRNKKNTTITENIYSICVLNKNKEICFKTFNAKNKYPLYFGQKRLINI